jgi:N-formylglutamate deformylase
MFPYIFHRGAQPLLVSIPHAGTEVPAEIARRFTDVGRDLPDTDWYVDKLYEFAAALGASIVLATYSRYVVDLNRAPDSATLYVSSPTSPVCAVQTFAGQAIYRAGSGPDEAEIADRVERYWHPYHQCIAEELWRIRSEHGYALLWDAHSIMSRVPGLFDGELPAFNLGTRDHAACPEAVAQTLLHAIEQDGRYSAVLNGRFKGGYITLAYGRPADRVWAVQLELAQRTYMNEAPRGPWEAGRATGVVSCIGSLLEQFLKSARG